VAGFPIYHSTNREVGYSVDSLRITLVGAGMVHGYPAPNCCFLWHVNNHNQKPPMPEVLQMTYAL